MNSIAGLGNTLPGASAVNQVINQNPPRPKGATLDQRATNLIKAHDQNGDGLLTAQELNVSADLFKKIDTNGNGTADQAELKNADIAGHAANQNVQGTKGLTIDQRTTNLIKAHDQNGDGLLTAQELKVPAELFKKIDTNGNGTADRAELNKAYVAGHAANEYLKAAGSSTSPASHSPVSIIV